MKGKGKVLPAKARGGGGPQRRPSNPFEIKKTKTRFDTVGRRLKGSTKNVVRAREQAIDKVGLHEFACISSWHTLGKAGCPSGRELLPTHAHQARRLQPPAA